MASDSQPAPTRQLAVLLGVISIIAAPLTGWATLLWIGSSVAGAYAGGGGSVAAEWGHISLFLLIVTVATGIAATTMGQGTLGRRLGCIGLFLLAATPLTMAIFIKAVSP